MAEIPNLFRGARDISESQLYYHLFLSRLQRGDRAERIIQVSRQIRRFASGCGLPEAGAFAYQWEMNAHGKLGDFDSMWRVLRAQEKVVFKKSLNLRQYRWKTADADFHQLIFFYGPLSYLRGNYRLGCRLMETALRMSSRRKGWSFEMLWSVYKPLEHPTSPSDVTLSHFYSALGQNLTQWSLWNRFVDDLHPKLFRMSGVSRAALRQDPALMKPLFEWIVSERRKQLFSGVSHGLRDLTETQENVRKRQAITKKKILKIDEDPRWVAVDRRLQELFPELSELPARSTLRQSLESRRSRRGS